MIVYAVMKSAHPRGKTAFPEALARELGRLGELRIDEPMSAHTTFRVGGPADLLLFPRDAVALRDIRTAVQRHGVPLTIAGGGSNLLVGDAGIRGVTVILRESASRLGALRHEGGGAVYAEAIVSKERFVRTCAEWSLEGMEFMAGIPGCLGGGIMMNAGTTEGNFIDILDRIDFIDEACAARSQGITREMGHYRKMDVERGAIVTGALFRLRPSREALAVKEKIARILAERREKHPLDYPSAGSVFKNPEGHSSWKLINDAGLKGYRIGGAMVSTLHTNFIVNADRARAADILRLIEHIQETVSERFGVRLEPEVRVLGDF